MILDYSNVYDFPEGTKYYYVDMDNIPCIKRLILVNHKLFKCLPGVNFYTTAQEAKEELNNSCYEKIKEHQKYISVYAQAMSLPLKTLIK
jgi:hypothetical protein